MDQLDSKGMDQLKTSLTVHTVYLLPKTPLTLYISYRISANSFLPKIVLQKLFESYFSLQIQKKIVVTIITYPLYFLFLSS
jgi:hypothetical protein